MSENMLYFYIFLVTTIAGLITFMLRICYASKCTNVEINRSGLHIERHASMEMKDIHKDGRTQSFEGNLKKQFPIRDCGNVRIHDIDHSYSESSN